MGSAFRRVGLLAALVLITGVLIVPAPASANLPGLLSTCAPKDALDDNTADGSELPFAFCDDSVPAAAGGTTPNLGAVNAIAVPAAYTGPGQPVKDPTASVLVPGSDPAGNIAIDADLSVPDPTRYPVPAAGYPLVVMMHGCCSGSKNSWEGPTIDPGGSENWHYNNAWFASRGYVVLNFTARGFVDGQNRGSTGQTQLDSDRFEINDYQHLAGQLADTADLNPNTPQAEKIDPQRIVPTGGSYGGGFSWMALTDPTWKSPGGKDMKVVAVATKYGWTNLVESLVPNGADLRDALPSLDPAQAATPIGFPKRTIVAALYASGKTGVPPGSAHTTFDSEIDQAIVCLESSDPYEQNPLCSSTLATTLPRFIEERSAFYQNDFFSGLASGAVDPVPVYSAGTFTDKLFPAPEHRRMVERLKATVPGYPVEEYYGDYNHFVQNKRKEWADLCGADRHVCRYDDYPAAGTPSRDLNAVPVSPARDPGVTSRLNRFIDHYAKPQGNQGEPQPAFDVTGALQVCPQNGPALGIPLDEPGPRFTAPSYAELAPGRLTVSATGAQATTSLAGANPHAKNADPVSNQAANGGRCPVESSPGGLPSAGPGVATYDSDLLPAGYTMLGSTRVVVGHTGTGSDLQLNARLYDLFPDGTQVLVDRGVKRITIANGVTTLDLHGAGWYFPQGHRLRLELAQDDDPYIKSSAAPGSLVIAAVELSVPVREASAAIGGARAPGIDVTSPRLASDKSRTRRFAISIRLRPGASRASIGAYQLQIRDRHPGKGAQARTARVRVRASAERPRVFRFRGRAGHTYRIRARAIDKAGRTGRWDGSRTIVPFDDARRATKGLSYRGGWSRLSSRRAYGGRLSRTTRRGARLRFRFRGDRLFIVGRTGRRGGKALVRLNGRRRVISFYTRRTHNRRVVATLRAKRRGVNRLQIVNLGRKGSRRARGTRVEIDALGVRRQ